MDGLGLIFCPYLDQTVRNGENNAPPPPPPHHEHPKESNRRSTARGRNLTRVNLVTGGHGTDTHWQQTLTVARNGRPSLAIPSKNYVVCGLHHLRRVTSAQCS